MQQQCIVCSKKYKNPSQLQKHTYLCRLLHQSKTLDVTEDVPSSRAMYIMLLELGKKYNVLEEKYNTLLQQQPQLKKVNKKVDFLEGLNANTDVSSSLKRITMLTFLERAFTTTIDNIERLFITPFMDVLDTALRETDFTRNDCPIICNKNILYGYLPVNKDEAEHGDWKWCALTKEQIMPVLSKLKRLLFAVAYQHRLDNKELMQEDEKVEEQFDLMMNKIVSIEVSNDNTYHKMKKIFIKHLQFKQQQQDSYQS
jgi:hypothetical protein